MFVIHNRWHHTGMFACVVCVKTTDLNDENDKFKVNPKQQLPATKIANSRAILHSFLAQNFTE